MHISAFLNPSVFQTGGLQWFKGLRGFPVIVLSANCLLGNFACSKLRLLEVGPTKLVLIGIIFRHFDWVPLRGFENLTGF